MRLLPPNQETGWTPYAWLLYVLIFLVYPVVGNASAKVWAWTALAVFIFVPLYFWGHWLQGRQTLWVIAAITALGCVYGPFNAGASVFLVFAACFVGQLGESAIAFRYLAGLQVITAAEAWLLHLPINFWLPAMFFSIVLGSVDIHFTQQRRVNRKLRLAQQEIEHLAKVAERERIARDLHDVLGHTLSLIILKSELASKLADGNPARAAAEIRDVERISREALAEVRSAVKGYRSAGLESELEHARQTLDTAGVRADISIERPNVPPPYETVLVLALREAVTNVVRHAQATSCRLRVQDLGSWCELEISDNGRGGSTPEGSGLSGMRTRVEALGGTLERYARNGTTLRVRLPLNVFDTSAASGAA